MHACTSAQTQTKMWLNFFAAVSLKVKTNERFVFELCPCGACVREYTGACIVTFMQFCHLILSVESLLNPKLYQAVCGLLYQSCCLRWVVVFITDDKCLKQSEQFHNCDDVIEQYRPNCYSLPSYACDLQAVQVNLFYFVWVQMMATMSTSCWLRAVGGLVLV